MMNSASSRLLCVGRHDVVSVLASHGLVRRNEKRIPQLVRDDDRAHVLEVAKLDHLLVDRDRRDRIETGGRLVVEQDARLGGHGASNRDAAPLPARELRRHAVDELRQPNEPEHFLDAGLDLVRLAYPSLRTACSRRSPRPSANRTARLPGTPSRRRRASPSVPARSSCRRARRSPRSRRHPVSRGPE